MTPQAAANLKAGGNVAAVPIFSPSSQTTNDLIKKQTEAIEYLSGRIDKLEAKIEALSKKSEAKK